MKFQVDRKQWLRGEGSSLLRRSDERMCCLGFRELACGRTEAQIAGRVLPCIVARELGVLPPGQEKLTRQVNVGFYPTDQCLNIARVNDDPALTDRERLVYKQEQIEGYREQKLIELFAEIGDEVEFVG